MDQSIRILVVDDEPDIRRIIRILLEGRGYHVTEAPNGLLEIKTYSSVCSSSLSFVLSLSKRLSIKPVQVTITMQRYRPIPNIADKR